MVLGGLMTPGTKRNDVKAMLVIVAKVMVVMLGGFAALASQRLGWGDLSSPDSVANSATGFQFRGAGIGGVVFTDAILVRLALPLALLCGLSSLGFLPAAFVLSGLWRLLSFVCRIPGVLGFAVSGTLFPATSLAVIQKPVLHSSAAVEGFNRLFGVAYSAGLSCCVHGDIIGTAHLDTNGQSFN